MVLYGKSLQEYSVNTSVTQGSILCSTLFQLYIDYLTHGVISNTDDTTLYPKCDQAYGL